MKNSNLIPEFYALQDLDGAPPSSFDNTLQIRSEAYLQRLVATPQIVAPARQARRLSFGWKLIIATLSAALVGGGGLTAAAAAGYSNPVGDWVMATAPGNWSQDIVLPVQLLPTEDGQGNVVAMVPNKNDVCFAGIELSVRSDVLPASEQAMSVFGTRTGEAMLGWSTMGSRKFEPDHVISQVRAILGGIDLTVLPGTMPQVAIQHFEPEPIEGVLQVGQTTGLMRIIWLR